MSRRLQSFLALAGVAVSTALAAGTTASAATDVPALRAASASPAPASVRPARSGPSARAITAPDLATLSTEGSVGSRAFTATTDTAGPFSTRTSALTGSTSSGRTFAATNEEFEVPLELPTGTPGLVAARTTPATDRPGDDIDLELYAVNADGSRGARVAAALHAGSHEVLRMRADNGGRFVLRVFAYDLPNGPTTFRLQTWNTGAPTGGATLSVRGTPTDPVAAGQRIDLCPVAEGLGDDEYLGLVSYHASADGSGPAVGSTAIDVLRGPEQAPCAVVPETVLDDAPADPTSDPDAAFVFSSPQAASVGVRFECRLDDAAAFTACTSPYVPAGLTDGRHRLAVRAATVGGGPDPTPAEHGWTLDRSAPAAPVVTGAPATSTTLRRADLAWTGEPDGGYACRLGDGAWAPCTSPVTYEDLPLGPQIFEVRQTDLAGNVGAVARATWTVTVAPAPVEPTDPPAGPALPPATPVSPADPAVPPAPVPAPTAPAPRPAAPAPAARLARVSVPPTIGARGRTIPVGCRVDRGTLTRCVVVARLGGRVVGRGSAGFDGVRSGEVAVRLTAEGLAAIERLGGARLEFRTTVTAGGRRLTASTRALVRPSRTVVVPAQGLFASGSARLSAAGRRLVSRVGGGVSGAKRVTCVGHTDAVGPARPNVRLGLARARAVCGALRHGRTRLATRSTSAGESRPRATNRTRAGRALNRRVELVVAYR